MARHAGGAQSLERWAALLPAVGFAEGVLGLLLVFCGGEGAMWPAHLLSRLDALVPTPAASRAVLRQVAAAPLLPQLVGHSLAGCVWRL